MPTYKAILGQVSDYDIRLLKIFKSVVEHHGMAAAELELNIGLSTISRHIKDLEERVGMTLCQRGRGGFSLTQEGERVYQSSLVLLASLQSFRNTIQEMHGELAGTLSMGMFEMTITNPNAHIHRALREFRKQTPNAQLDMSIGKTNDIEQGVLDGRLNVGIVPFYRRSSMFNYYPLFRETMFLYCAKDHPLASLTHQNLRWQDLQPYQFIGLGFNSINMSLSTRKQLNRTLMLTDQEIIAMMLLAGDHYAFLPDHYAEDLVRKGDLVKINQPKFSYTVVFNAIIRHAAKPTRLTQHFLNILTAVHP
jgi:DNA-binding transcriptional LysR family regulator